MLSAQEKTDAAKTDKFAEAYKDADESVDRNRDTNSFFALGVTVGQPASLNAHAAFYMWRFVIRGSGMYYGANALGIQGDLGFSFLNGARVRHTLSFVAGYTRRNPLFILDPNFPDVKTASLLTGTYLGGAYELFMDGFFVQAGIGNGMPGGEMKTPILIFQAGYLFYFPQ